MSATARQEREMKTKYEKMKQNPDLSPLDRLRAHVLADGVRSLKSLHRIFKRIDENGDHKMDIHEFKGALKVMGISTEEESVQTCFSEMDRDGAGSIDSEEFIVALRPKMSTHRRDLVNQAFRKLDKDGSGLLEIDDLRGVYSAKKHAKYVSGEWTEEDVFKQFLNSFNGPNNTTGQVQQDEFEDYYAGVSASIDTDAYFDLMMRQAWKL